MRHRASETIENPRISSKLDWNLTKPEWAADATDDARLGTAIIWLIDQSGAYEQLFISSVSYNRTGKIVAALWSYPMTAREEPCWWVLPTQIRRVRWVPDDVKGFSEILESPTADRRCTNGLECVDVSCRCIGGECRRK